MHQIHGLDIPETLAEACHPHRTALVVYDMQVGILRQMHDGAGVRRTSFSPGPASLSPHALTAVTR